MKGAALLRILEGPPLNYTVERATGSHRKLVAAGRPPLFFAFHDRADVPPGLVRKILVKDVGLSVDEAEDLL